MTIKIKEIVMSGQIGDIMSVIHVDADSNGQVRAIRFLLGDFTIMGGRVRPTMPLNDYYDIVEEWGIARFVPGEYVTSSSALVSTGAVGYMRINSEMLVDYMLFTPEYIDSWGPVR